MLADPYSVAIHEAGHAAVAFLRGIPIVRVGLTPGDPLGNAGVCETEERSADTMGLVDFVNYGMLAVGGGVAQQLAGRSASFGAGDRERLSACKWWFDQKARGQVWPDVYGLARHQLSCPIAWAGVVALARRIVASGGMLSGAAAKEAMRAGWRGNVINHRT
jgi:hypothetical protein